MTAIDTFLLGVFLFVIGACLGSFVNVLIYRIPLQLQREWEEEARSILALPSSEEARETVNIAKPSSHCPKCKAALKPYHNIPLVSYLFLRGKCAYCSTPIPWQYPLIEFAGGTLAVISLIHFGISLEAGLAIVYSLSLLALTGIDFRTQLLPDNITLPLLWLGLLANTQNLYVDLEASVWGAALGYLSLWSIYWIFKLLTGKEGMGYGDFKLLAALGAWGGWQMLPLTILLSSLVGAFVGVAMIWLRGRDKQLPFAFGPYLAIAGWISFFWGDQILKTYLEIVL